ncbi:MAG: tetratricopeptide repeat protein [Pseudolabrys sp.]
MQRDTRGLALSTDSAEAARLFDRAIGEYLEYRKTTLATVTEALDADPDFCLGHCFVGYLFMLYGSDAVDRKVDAALAHAERLAPQASEREQKHVAALRAWRQGDGTRANRIWDDILVAHPHDMPALRLQHFSLFWAGQAYFMRDAAARALGAWDESMPGYSHLLGMYSFALEECGDYGAAEPKGRRAVELCGDDLWAIHAVSHVLEMQGRLKEGVDWLKQPFGAWADRNPFRLHLWWHTALFPFELGQYDRVLEFYDREIRADPSEFYLDIQNAASMLFRLEWCGVDVGQRWKELAEIAEKRIDDHVLAFTDQHFMLALCRDGRLDAAERLLASFNAFATTRGNSTAATMQPAAIPVAEAMLAYAKGDYRTAIEKLATSRYRWQLVGASHAQRDLFTILLIASAEKAHDWTLARALLRERMELRPHSAGTHAHYRAAMANVPDIPTPTH